ncbi:MAG: flagellin [bacterium]
MSVVVNSNVSSLIAQRSLGNNVDNLRKVFERLSTGSKINSAKDDAAGLSISEKLRMQLKGYEKAVNNTKDGANALKIVDSSLDTMLSNLQRVRELCVQGANGIYSSTERTYILNEIKERLKDFNRTVITTKFDKTPLLTAATMSLRIQTGPGTNLTANTIDIATAFSGQSVTVTGLGLSSAMTATGSTWDPTAIRTYMDLIDTGLDKLLSVRSKIGGMMNRLDSVLTNLSAMQENLQASESTIRDTDIAKDTADMTRYQILQQSSTQVLAQINQLPAMALKLLGG